MNILKRFLALMLAMCMMLTAVPFGAFAADGDATHMASKPADGTVTGEPFNDDASLSGNSPEHTNHRIPGLVKLNNGTLVASADIRYDYEYDGGGSDIVVSRSTDGGATWNYSVVAYLGDQGNIHAKNASTMMDPVLITDGTNLYLLYDLFPAGYSLGGGSNTTYAFSATGTGFDSQGRLLLGKTYNSTDCGYYLDGGEIFASDGSKQEGYTVDEWFNVYENGTYVSNLFFVESPFYAYPTSYACIQTSTDGGDSWSDPEMLKTKHDGTKWQVLGPGSGIVTSSDELAFTVYNSDSSISLVHGTPGNWTTVKTSAAVNESSVVELSDGTIRAFVKNDDNLITYVDFTKSGNSYTAGSAVSTGVSNTGWCMISSMVYSKKIDGKEVIMVCCPSTGSSNRANGKIHVFKLDSNKNMSLVKSHEINGANEFFAYSDMVEMEDGTIALLYEDGCMYYNGSWAGAGVGYSHIEYTTVDPVEDMGLTFGDTAELPQEEITVEVGQTVEIPLSGDVGTGSQSGTAADVSWGAKEVTVKAPQAQTGTTIAYDGEKMNLNDCLYTFTKNSDGTWLISASADGTTVYVDPYVGGNGGYPNRSYTTNVTLTNGSNGGIWFGDGVGYLHFWDNSTTNLYWDNCTGTSCSGHNLQIYKVADTSSETVLGGYYTQITDVAKLESGEAYLIVGHTTSGYDSNGYYAMRPSTSTSDKFSHLAKITGEIDDTTTTTNTLTITGKAVGTTTVEIGGTTYAITVKNEGKEINLVVGQSVTDTIEGSAYTMDDAAVADESIATISKVEQVSVPGDTETTVSTTKAAALEDGTTYIIRMYNTTYALSNNTGSTAWGTQTLAFETNTLTANEDHLWTLEAADGGFKLKNANGYLNLGTGNNTAYLDETGEVFTITSTDSGWTICNPSGEYINNLGNSNNAGGWTGNGTRFDLYKVETVTNSTTNTVVTFTGIKAGTTTATVGNVKYSITVEGDEREINLVVGQSKTDVIENANYDMDDVNVDDETIATIDNVATVVTSATKELKAVTAIESGKQYIIVNKRAGTEGSAAPDLSHSVLTATQNNNSLYMNGPVSEDCTELWIITGNDQDGYTIMRDGKYLTFAYDTSTMTTTETHQELIYDTANGWLIKQDSNYLSDMYGTGSTNAHGYNQANDGGNYWIIYELVTTSEETDTVVTFTGHKVGTTTATVGNVKYNITVEEDIRDITLHVGQTQTFYIDGYSYDAGSVVDSGIAKLDSVVAKGAKLVSVDEIVSEGQYLIVASQTGEVLTDTAITLTGDAGQKSALVTEGSASVDNTELWTITGDAANGYTVVQNGKYLTVAGYYAAMSDTPTKLKLTHSNSGWMICDDTTWESLGHNEADYYLRNGIADANYDADAMGSSITSSQSYWYIYKIDQSPVTEVTFTGVKAGETTATVGHVTFNITVDTVVAGDISDFNNIVGKGTYSDDNANANNRSDLDMTGKKITSLRITEGAEFQLDVDVTGYESVTWTTDDPAIATVDSTGMVTAVNEGQTFVTATVIKNGVEESIRIPVTVVPSLVEDATSVTSVFYYIEQIDYTDPYYTMFLSTESATEPVAGHDQVKVSEGEVIWYERPTNSAFAWVWTADPWEGYALTYMASTGSVSQYYPLRDPATGQLGESDYSSTTAQNPGEYYKYSISYKNIESVGNDVSSTIGAGWRAAVDDLLDEAILVGINVYPNYGCDGAMSNTRWDHDGVPKLVTSMTFISDPMPQITKTVNGVLPTTRLRKDFKPYTDGMVATVGEYVYFQIDVTLERPTVWADEANGIGAITYTEAMVTDTVLPGAYFYVQANDTNMDGVISGDEISDGQDVDITDELNAAWEEDEQVRKISLYLVYEIQNEDIPKFIIDNTANLAWKYQSHYSTGTLAGKADAKASITVVGYAMDNVVIDFGQKVVYTGLTDAHLKYVTLGEHQTKYGTAVVAGVGAEQDDGLGNKYYNEYTVTYTPNSILQEPDAVQLSGTYLDEETDKTVSKVINGFLVYPATTVYYEEGFMINGASTDWTTGEKATMTQTFELLSKSVYNADKTLTGYESDKTHAYGYDPIYDDVDASKITQATATETGAATTFTFTGTGFDLYANCTESTGSVAVQIKDASGKAVRLYTVDTKVGEEKADSGDATDGQTGSMYSLPIISEHDLPHGTYTVRIMKSKGGAVNLDGVRIFNTFDETPYKDPNSKAESPFAIDLEDLPEFYELRDYVLHALNISDTTSADYGKLEEMAGQVYAQISTDSEAPAVILAQSTGEYVGSDEAQNLLDNGPKNELYLHQNETLVFNVTTSRAMQIGLKAPAGTTSYSITGATTKTGTLNSTVDMFYELDNTIGTETTYTITITNTGSNILSVTDLKICDDPNAAFVALTEDDIETALVAMGYTDNAVAENATTGVGYDNVSDALNAAKEGETVKLLADCTATNLMVTSGVTLDLNGFHLTASYVVAFDTAHVIDSVGSGSLITGVKNLVLNEGNSMIPVYNGTAYVFTKAGFAVRQDTAYTGDGIKINAMAYPVQMDVVELLKNGGDDNNVEIVIRLSWDTDQGTGSQEFKFTDEIVASVYSSNNGSWNSYSKMFGMTVTGFENIKNLKANVIVKSGTNVEYVSSTSLSITN